MRLLIERFGFGLGLAGALVSLSYYLQLSIVGESGAIVVVLKVLALLVLVGWLPVAQPAFLNPWQPLFSPSAGRRTAARLGLGVAGLVTAFHFILVWFGSANGVDWEHRTQVAAAAFLFLNFLYFVAHWAIRPENIFPPQVFSVLQVAPYTLGRWKRKRRASRIRAQRNRERADSNEP